MKRLITILIVVVILIGLAWLLPHSLISVKWQTSDTQSETTAVESTATETEWSDIPVSYQNVSFSIPAGLASGAKSEAIPANPGPMGASPEFIQFTITGYQFPSINEGEYPQVRVYPADEYAAVSPWAAESLKRLKNVLANPSMQLDNDNLPNIPFRGSAAQLYAAQVKQYSFNSGSGVRMVSSYAQYPAPVGRKGNLYHYEGLTHDGKYFVVVCMPVELPVWSDASNPGDFGITYPANYQGWDDVKPYYKSVSELISQADPGGFNPFLTQLDALVQSITVVSK